MEATGRAEANNGRGAMSLQISNEMTRLYKDMIGRGPTRVRTEWCSDDLIVVQLEKTLTRAEAKMVALGEHQRLRDMRMFFQYAMRADFITSIERITGRTVRAFISGIDAEVDGLSLESFVLYPEGSDAPSRTGLIAGGGVYSSEGSA